MPNETKNYGTVITTAGAALIAKCILNGGKVNIKTAAAGDGGGEYYEPTVAQTALRGKKWEGDVASAAVSTTNANMIDVKIIIDDSVGGFTIREMASLTMTARSLPSATPLTQKRCPRMAACPASSP